MLVHVRNIASAWDHMLEVTTDDGAIHYPVCYSPEIWGLAVANTRDLYCQMVAEGSRGLFGIPTDAVRIRYRLKSVWEWLRNPAL